MAAPNIVNVTNITGKTSVANVTTTSANLVVNSAGSNQVFKINSLIISNVDGSTSADVTVKFNRSSADYAFASTITVAADSTLVVISKDNSVYLEEGDSINILASANNDLQAICSYEIIS